jgi:hypothetical protein
VLSISSKQGESLAERSTFQCRAHRLLKLLDKNLSLAHLTTASVTKKKEFEHHFNQELDVELLNEVQQLKKIKAERMKEVIELKTKDEEISGKVKVTLSSKLSSSLGK